VTKDSDFKKLVRQRMAATGQSYTAARAALYRSGPAPDLPLTRRVFGLQASYTAAFNGAYDPGETGTGEYLFRWLPGWGRVTNAYLENGARIYLRPAESGAAQPAYSTPECDSIVDLLAAERAGDEILSRMAARAEESLTSDGTPAALAVSRLAGAQSESYLVASAVAAERYLRLLEPFLATRWVCGQPAALPVPQAAMSAASFADESRYRRLKITGADPTPSQWSTFLKVGVTEQVLRLAESGAQVSLDNRGEPGAAAAVNTQRAYLAAARRIRPRPEDDVILDAWQSALDTLEDGLQPPGASQDGASIATAAQIEAAVDLPPQTTRARLRGLFIKTARDHRRNFAVDWVHLKLMDSASRTVRCSDPLNINSETVERLITSISEPPV
jgi:proteasome accessory factor A